MWRKWLPWKYVFRKLALYHGFADPITVLSHIRRFSQPAEVNEPIELLRAGVVFHARGLINGRVIQHNMDWIWPYWINRQFNPQNEAFIPGAVSFSHVNLSGRNWTAVGVPDYANYPIVDPRGLVTPFWDGWSIDAWFITDKGEIIAPCQMQDVEQTLDMSDGLSIITRFQTADIQFQNKTQADWIEEKLVCRIQYSCTSKSPAKLAISLRPYNPEGISFIHNIIFSKENISWKIDNKRDILLDKAPHKHLVSDYHHGDVSLKKEDEKENEKIECSVGMATAAAIYDLQPGVEFNINAVIPLNGKKNNISQINYFAKGSGDDLWKWSLKQYCKLNLPWGNIQYVYDAAIRSVILHSPGEVYPGPFTYKRFWFRDAALILNAIISAGMIKRAEKIIDGFFAKQTAFGYFHSQEGEWDSNGQVLWIINKYCQLTAAKPKNEWLQPVIKGAKWIIRKRISTGQNTPTAGLLPAGFSAEHLGPSDFYYWDDFWAAAGLYAAAQMLEGTQYSSDAKHFHDQAEDMTASIEKSLLLCHQRIGRPAIPASPHRRLDSGAVGSLAACFPTELFNASDERVKDTAEYLMQNCIVKDCFYHEISHSGVNPYLTLHLAQVLMRAGDIRFVNLVKGIAALASPTAQWPEAANPRIGTGCMGDGQHIWASAEWIMMIINSFVLEEDKKLIIGKGVFPDWLKQGTKFSIGPVSTSFGPVNINFSCDEKISVNWQGQWFAVEPKIEIAVPGYKNITSAAGKNNIELEAI
ncbi:MAG: hypothetical protein A2Y10_05300 [Planctomycetes bacterium GWF2_41_51]|nr:MAG: hypothetical protein A2Y10_05300 [Planctomycetes bacterium GWF2_41_51]HBG25520.1 hypothetical protein [Phycisphaerales bacterium]